MGGGNKPLTGNPPPPVHTGFWQLAGKYGWLEPEPQVLGKPCPHLENRRWWRRKNVSVVWRAECERNFCLPWTRRRYWWNTSIQNPASIPTSTNLMWMDHSISITSENPAASACRPVLVVRQWCRALCPVAFREQIKHLKPPSGRFCAEGLTKLVAGFTTLPCTGCIALRFGGL